MTRAIKSRGIVTNHYAEDPGPAAAADQNMHGGLEVEHGAGLEAKSL